MPDYITPEYITPEYTTPVSSNQFKLVPFLIEISPELGRNSDKTHNQFCHNPNCIGNRFNSLPHLYRDTYSVAWKSSVPEFHCN